MSNFQKQQQQPNQYKMLIMILNLSCYLFIMSFHFNLIEIQILFLGCFWLCINIVMLDMLHYITSILCKKCSSSMLFVNNLYIGRHFYFVGNKSL